MAQDLGPVSDPLKVLIEALKAFLSPGTTTLVVGAIVVLVLFKYFGVGKQIAAVYRWLTTRTDKRRVGRRARFADHIESQMRWLGHKEEWRDHRYAELEAELEITGRQRVWFLRRTPLNSLKRVPSLSKALEECEDRIVLLEGEPGAGKSVAMRHLTQRMAAKAMRRPSERSVIPIYVNLKTFEPAGVPTAADLRTFVIGTVNAARDRDIEQFLEDEFDRGMQEGTWLFLFDSFDEIPEILSATSANEAIEAYAGAVHDFLHGMKACRGVVASREFRGPGRASWPTFRVVPLSEQRKRLLIEKSDLPRAIEHQLLVELPNAEVSVQQMSGNPLFLGLLCEHMRQGNDFPTNVHAVLETYIGHRLVRDTEFLRGNFDVSSDDVRVVAEELAFLIASRQSLGLDVPKAQAVRLLVESLRLPSAHLARSLDALIYTKIARTGDDEGSVTFSHRRLQEYFATCVVIREPDRVPARTLLTSGRWRETAVTILQTQRADHASRLLAEAVRLLPAEVPGMTGRGYDWPPGLLYLLGILAEGGASVPQAGPLLKEAWDEGVLLDRKSVLEVCSVADPETCRRLLAQGFASRSEWLRQEAFLQMRRVPKLAPELEDEIRQMLLDRSVGGKLRRERLAVLAQLRRLPNPRTYERVLRLLVAGPFLYVAAVSMLSLLTLVPIGINSQTMLVLATFACTSAVYLIVRLFYCSPSTSTSRLQEVAPALGERHAVILLPIVVLLDLVMLMSVLNVVQRSSVLWFVALVVADLIVFSLPVVLLSTVKRGEERVFRDLTELFRSRTILSAVGATCVGLLVSMGFVFLLNALITFLGLRAIVSLVFGLALGSGLIWLIVWAARLVVSHRVQRRQIAAFKRQLDRESFSLEALRRCLLDATTPYVVNATLLEMHRRDVRWSGEVMAFLDDLVIALEKRDHDLVDLLQKVRNREWLTSPEVLDQLCILVSAQRRKAEAIPR